jgi:hypothetical protein
MKTLFNIIDYIFYIAFNIFLLVGILFFIAIILGR